MGDSYRPSRQRSRSPPRGFTGNANSRYRDQEFSFEHSQRLPERDGNDFADGNRRRPPTGPRDPGRSRGGGGFRGRGGGASRGGRPAWKPPPPAHDRAILNFDFREKTPELLEGMVTGGFEPPPEDEAEHDGDDNKEAEDEAPMEISDDEDDSNAKPTAASIPPATPTETMTAELAPEPVSKPTVVETFNIHMEEIGQLKFDPANGIQNFPSAATKTDKATQDTKPSSMATPAGTKSDGTEKKLEVVEGQDFVEADKKRMDVISMIRQAKAEAAKKAGAVKKDSVAANDDFISFGFDEKPKSPESDYENDRNRKMRRLNDGSKEAKSFSFKEHVHGVYVAKPSEEAPGVGPLSRAGKLGPPPGPSKSVREALKRRRGDDYDDDDYDSSSSDYHSESDSGKLDHPDVPQNRKRKYEEITNNRNSQSIDGNIKRELRATPGINPIPWNECAKDHSKTVQMTMWLHKEIIDFMDYIKPRPVEHAVRRYVVQSLRKIVQSVWGDTDVRVFGSFAADLYLPTSDIDVVVVSKDYARYEDPRYDNKRSIWSLTNAIRNAGIAEQGSVTPITGAKVPIIKYVDRATGLHVDISFENKSGLVANETFRNWKEKYPSLPILLTLVKHFLSMRGLNEVYLGGVGSFTITCLIVSLFQNLPAFASGEVDPMSNLGVTFLEFLDLYGKRFNTRKVGIRVDTWKPGYFRRDDLFTTGPRSKPSDETLLVIQDPNVADNIISKSSYLIRLVFATFGEAYDALVNQMSALDKMDFEARKGRSLLGLIIGGDYRKMEEHRERLRQVYCERIGHDKDLRELDPEEIPPPPPLPVGLPPPPPKSHGHGSLPPPPPSLPNPGNFRAANNGDFPRGNGKGDFPRGNGGNQGGNSGNQNSGGRGGKNNRNNNNRSHQADPDDAFERLRAGGGGKNTPNHNRSNNTPRGGRNAGGGGRGGGAAGGGGNQNHGAKNINGGGNKNGNGGGNAGRSRGKNSNKKGGRENPIALD